MWTMSDLILENFAEANLYLWSALFVFFIGLTLVCERLIAYFFKFNLDVRNFISKIRKASANGDEGQIDLICKKTSKHGLAKICKEAKDMLDTDPSLVKAVIDENALQYRPEFTCRVSLISVCAFLCFSICVLASLSAIYELLSMTELLDSYEKQLLLSKDLAQTLSFSAFGLAMAVVLSTCYFFVKENSFRLLDKFEYGVLAIENIFVPQHLISAAPASYSDLSSGSADLGLDQLDLDEEPLGAKEATGEENTLAAEDSSPALEEFESSELEDIKDEEEII